MHNAEHRTFRINCQAQRKENDKNKMETSKWVEIANSTTVPFSVMIVSE